VQLDVEKRDKIMAQQKPRRSIFPSVRNTLRDSQPRPPHHLLGDHVDAILAAHFTSRELSLDRRFAQTLCDSFAYHFNSIVGLVGTVVVASNGANASPLVMSHDEVFAHTLGRALFSQPLLRPVFDLQKLDPFERHIA
jgi:hypothetical protein